jgi:hypothetical protein
MLIFFVLFMNKLIKLSRVLSHLGLHNQANSILKLSGRNSHFLSQQNLDDLAKIAQEVYDEWEQNEEGWSDSHGEIGYGGICHIIADRLVEYLDRAGFGSKHNFCSMSDMYVQHVYVMAWVELEKEESEEDSEEGGDAFYDIYNIDIPYWTYESGGGFTWKKIDGVKFTGDDVVVEKIASNINEEELSNYLDN